VKSGFLVFGFAGLLASSPKPAGSLSGFAGSYRSSPTGDCTLDLNDTGTVTVGCPGEPARTGTAVARRDGFVVLIPRVRAPLDPDSVVPAGHVTFLSPAKEASTSTSHPPLQDPTAPLVALEDRGNAIELQPILWAERRYLVGDLEAFCAWTRAQQSAVLRSTLFLKAGDEKKPSGVQPPAVCGSAVDK
jgi:hypothetical protein